MKEMIEENKTTGNDLAMNSTELGIERTMLAHERTLMAWVRTATSMITFGFTLYKIFEEMSKNANAPERILTPRVAGMLMILFGLVGLLLALIQHYRAMRTLRKHFPQMHKSISAMLGILILLFGLTMFLGALFRQ